MKDGLPVRHHRSLLSCLMGMGLLLPAAPAWAQRPAGSTGTPDSPLTIEMLSTMAGNLGYATKPGSDPQTFSITQDSQLIYISMTAPGSPVNIYAVAGYYSSAELIKLDLLSLMEKNDSSGDFYALRSSKDHYYLDFQTYLPASIITPTTLRASIVSLRTELGSAEDIWNKAKWSR